MNKKPNILISFLIMIFTVLSMAQLSPVKAASEYS